MRQNETHEQFLDRAYETARVHIARAIRDALYPMYRYGITDMEIAGMLSDLLADATTIGRTRARYAAWADAHAENLDNEEKG